MRAMKDVLERLAGRLESWVDAFARNAAWLVLAVVFLLFVQNPLCEYVGRGCRPRGSRSASCAASRRRK
jgi:hypothetical protein